MIRPSSIRAKDTAAATEDEIREALKLSKKEFAVLLEELRLLVFYR